MATTGPERTTPWSLPQSLEVTPVAHSREPRGHGGGGQGGTQRRLARWRAASVSGAQLAQAWQPGSRER